MRPREFWTPGGGPRGQKFSGLYAGERGSGGGSWTPLRAVAGWKWVSSESTRDPWATTACDSVPDFSYDGKWWSGRQRG